MQNLQQENRQRGKSALKMGGISVQEHNIVIPGISLCQKWGKIRIFHSTIVALGEPKYIRFLFNPEKRGLVVQACARKEAECFRMRSLPGIREWQIWLRWMRLRKQSETKCRQLN